MNIETQVMAWKSQKFAHRHSLLFPVLTYFRILLEYFMENEYLIKMNKNSTLFPLISWKN